MPNSPYSSEPPSGNSAISSTHSVADRGSRLKMTACPAVGIVTASGTRVAAHVSPLGSDTTAPSLKIRRPLTSSCAQACSRRSAASRPPSRHRASQARPASRVAPGARRPPVRPCRPSGRWRDRSLPMPPPSISRASVVSSSLRIRRLSSRAPNSGL